MSNEPVVISVDLRERSYPIYIGAGLLHTLGDRFASHFSGRRAVIITDSNVGVHYAHSALESLQKAGIEATAMTVPAGEASKSLSQAADIFDFLAARRHERDDPIIALGGGMVGDLAGFVAATWMRGVPFVQCPTSLEAGIDAGIGGKTAVNHASGKNLIGAFHQPSFVCIDVSCLKTLERRDYRAALAESVKHAIIAGEDFLRWHQEMVQPIQKMEEAAVIELVCRNCEVKAKIVATDERETSTHAVGRAALNLGHTVGHAIESQLGEAIRHGEAVALGLIVELDLAVQHQGFQEANRQRCEGLLDELGLPIRSLPPLNIQDLLCRMKLDKKVAGGSLRFVLPSRPGAISWNKSITEANLRTAVDRIL